MAFPSSLFKPVEQTKSPTVHEMWGIDCSKLCGILPKLRFKRNDFRHQVTRAITNIFSNCVSRVLVNIVWRQNWNWFDIIGHDLIFWCNLMILAYLKFDKWYFIKTFGKAKFDASPDRTITQFQGREIFYTKQINS